MTLGIALVSQKKSTVWVGTACELSNGDGTTLQGICLPSVVLMYTLGHSAQLDSAFCHLWDGKIVSAFRLMVVVGVDDSSLQADLWPK